MATNPKTSHWKDCKEMINLSACPITGGLPTKMSRKAFASMCGKYRRNEVKLPSGMGRNIVNSSAAKMLPCETCGRGEKIERGERWYLPRECKAATI